MERYQIRFTYSGGEQIVGRGDTNETDGVMKYGIISFKPCTPGNTQRIKVSAWGNNKGTRTDINCRTIIL